MKPSPGGRLRLPAPTERGGAPDPGWAARTGADEDSLAAELEAALVDAIAGRSAHEALAGTLAREARAVLLRRGLGAARVVVERATGTFSVRVELPGTAARVLSVRVRVE